MVAETAPAPVTGKLQTATAQRAHVPCNLCGSEDPTAFCPSNGRGLVQCRRCGLVYVSPRPDVNALQKLYDASYFQSEHSRNVGYTNYLNDETNIRRTFARRLKRLERYAQAGRAVLDVGCATGFFLAEAHQQGWRVAGIDISPFAVQYARDRFGFDVRQGSLTDLDDLAGPFDLLTMWDVIEHVPDPKAYLERAAALLKPGAVIALTTPNVASLPARLTGSRWVGYKLSEEHVYYFSQQTLTQMLNEVGFEVVDAYHTGKYVTINLFLDRLGMYLPLTARVLQVVERWLGLSTWSLYVNPMDILAVTARRR